MPRCGRQPPLEEGTPCVTCGKGPVMSAVGWRWWCDSGVKAASVCAHEWASMCKCVCTWICVYLRAHVGMCVLFLFLALCIKRAENRSQLVCEEDLKPGCSFVSFCPKSRGDVADSVSGQSAPDTAATPSCQ